MMNKYTKLIKISGLTIYDSVPENLYIPNDDLEIILREGLRGFSTAGLPIRTRSKIVKSRICEILGYPIPKTFLKTQPRFLGQDFDTYIQKSDNLQIWNEEINPNRRYVLIREENNILTNVVVINGIQLVNYDTTGTLTQKFQARLNTNGMGGCLYSQSDTELLRNFVQEEYTLPTCLDSPAYVPCIENLLSISALYARLKKLIGMTFENPGTDQERNRGASLQKAVCEALGYKQYEDNGQFPDIVNQLLELKLQISPTIDLGLVSPASEEFCDFTVAGMKIRHCDIRYAIFDAEIIDTTVKIKGLYLSTGKEFFEHFQQFGGKTVNKKIQIPLPRGLL
ncbi:MAG: restriction endonuclease [Treponema sp.]|nr:restriction endonuclease [Treponema sp.]